jgi:hypothetical protein
VAGYAGRLARGRTAAQASSRYRSYATNRGNLLTGSLLMSTVMLTTLLTLATTAHPARRKVHFYVDCDSGLDSAPGSAAAPFRSLHRAQQAARSSSARRGSSSSGSISSTQVPPPPHAGAAAAVVHITGLCQLPRPLTLTAADSATHFVGTQVGTIISAGTQISIPPDALSGPIEIDLRAYNLSGAALGNLSARGYSGGSACILANNWEPSAAELFFRPDGPRSRAGARAYGPAQDGTMWVARHPNRAAGGLPAATDWAGITTVHGAAPSHSPPPPPVASKPPRITVGAFRPMLSQWGAELATGKRAMMHGLWSWNWADSHRPILAIDGENITVGCDDINRGGSVICHRHIICIVMALMALTPCAVFP